LKKRRMNRSYERIPEEIAGSHVRAEQPLVKRFAPVVHHSFQNFQYDSTGPCLDCGEDAESC
jgi:hypothetical protein